MRFSEFEYRAVLIVSVVVAVALFCVMSFLEFRDNIEGLIQFEAQMGGFTPLNLFVVSFLPLLILAALIILGRELLAKILSDNVYFFYQVFIGTFCVHLLMTLTDAGEEVVLGAERALPGFYLLYMLVIFYGGYRKGILGSIVATMIVLCSFGYFTFFAGVNAFSWIDKVFALWLVAIISGVMFQQASRKEQALVTEKNYSDSILENITAGVVTLDLEGRIASINTAGGQLMDASEWDDLAGRLVDDLELGEFRRFFASIEETLRHGTPLENAPLSFYRDGREYYYEYSTGILRNRELQITGALGVIRDLSDLKELENQMQMQKNLAMLGQFSAAVAHEIRNPLAVIKSSAQILAEGADEDDQEMAGYIIEEVARMNRLINELLNYSRPREIHFEMLDIADILARMVNATARDEEQVKLELERGPSPQVPGDADMLRQAFLNILKNALDAVSEKDDGRIGIHVESGGEHVHIIFEDNGPGIPPGKLDTIFQPFVTGKSKGTGLGLAITRKIIEAHRGDILVSSETGKGSVFTVKLPRTAPSEVGKGNDDAESPDS